MNHDSQAQFDWNGRAFSTGHAHVHKKSDLPSLFAYSVITGFVALVIGAAASLTVAATAGKVALWIAASSASSVAAGLIYESQQLRGLLDIIDRRFENFGRP